VCLGIRVYLQWRIPTPLLSSLAAEWVRTTRAVIFHLVNQKLRASVYFLLFGWLFCIFFYSPTLTCTLLFPFLLFRLAFGHETNFTSTPDAMERIICFGLALVLMISRPFSLFPTLLASLFNARRHSGVSYKLATMKKLHNLRVPRVKSACEGETKLFFLSAAH